MVKILLQHLIQAEAQVIFQAISTQKGMSKWWTRDCFVEPKIGFVNIFRFGELIVNKMTMVERVPEQKVVWECVETIDAWKNSRIIFEIDTMSDQQLLRFQHTGLQVVPEAITYYEQNWNRYLLSLKQFCETGKGEPFDTEIDNGNRRAFNAL